jgi:NAD-dependent SIR2 family protein deacetylase
MATPASITWTFPGSPRRPADRAAASKKPDVVFFGESVPRDQVAAAQAALEEADAMLVVGSSLMVYSGFRFAQMAAHRGKPIAAVNLGRTRADDLLALKVNDSCEAALSFLLYARKATEASRRRDRAGNLPRDAVR